MEIKRSGKICIVAAVLTLAAMMGWLLRPYPAIDGTKVHPALRGLDDSTACEWTTTGDGGSLSIRVTRPDGSEVIFCMSNSLDQSLSGRGELYMGAMHFSMPGATRVTGYDHTRFVVARLLARHLPDHPSLRKDIALITKGPSDWLSLMSHDGVPAVIKALRIDR